MPGDENNALGRQRVRHGNRLFRIAGVVADFEDQLLAHHPAGGIDVLYRHFRAAAHLFAKRCVLAGHRPRGRDAYLRMCSRTRGQQRGARDQSRIQKSHVDFSLVSVETVVSAENPVGTLPIHGISARPIMNRSPAPATQTGRHVRRATGTGPSCGAPA